MRDVYRVDLLWRQQQVQEAYISDQILVSCSAQHQFLSEKSHFCLNRHKIKPKNLQPHFHHRCGQQLKQLPLHKASSSPDLRVDLLDLQNFGLIL